MRSHSGNRPGFALAVALIAIVVIGAIIAGVFFASTQEYRIGRNTLQQTRAMATAEYGLQHILRPGLFAGENTMQRPVGGEPEIRVFSVNGSVDTLRLTRLNTNTFWAVSEGTAGAGVGSQARRRLGAAIVITPLDINLLGALTTRGTTQIGGSAFINGNDVNPLGWGCPAAGPALPGIAIPDQGLITTSGCNNLSCVAGDPKVEETAAAAEDSTYFKYGDIEWEQLVAMAQKIIPAGATLTGIGPTLDGTTCRTQDLLNWGDPDKLTTCGNYYPIIYAQGNLKITTGKGQGILLVEGDLHVQGGFEFFGPVIVKGRLRTEGTGGHFNGGVLAANVHLDHTTALGDAVIRYSSCVLRMATQSVVVPGMPGGNSWVEMF